MREHLQPSLFESLPEPLKYAIYGILFTGMFLIVVKTVAWEYRKQRHISVELLKAYAVVAALVILFASILMVYGPLSMHTNHSISAVAEVRKFKDVSWQEDQRQRQKDEQMLKRIERLEFMAEVALREY